VGTGEKWGVTAEGAHRPPPTPRLCRAEFRLPANGGRQKQSGDLQPRRLTSLPRTGRRKRRRRSQAGSDSLPAAAASAPTKCSLLGDLQKKPQKENYPRGDAENRGGELGESGERCVGAGPGLERRAAFAGAAEGLGSVSPFFLSPAAARDGREQPYGAGTGLWNKHGAFVCVFDQVY